MELRSALTEATRRGRRSCASTCACPTHGDRARFTLRILPVCPARTSEMSLLVLFETADCPPWSRRQSARTPFRRAPPNATSRGCAASWPRARSICNPSSTSRMPPTQELRAAHEEVLSSNEELQSTNEELETTKEELQSTNEELTTVNEQFQNRNRELDALTDDLSNFISSADLPMVTVGRDLSHPPAHAGGTEERSTCSRPTSAARSSTSSSRWSSTASAKRSSGDRHRSALGAGSDRP